MCARKGTDVIGRVFARFELIFNHLGTVKGLLFLKNGRLVDCKGFKHRPPFYTAPSKCYNIKDYEFSFASSVVQ